jgi:hypothetical protein
VILAIGHALRAHQALSRPDALPGFLEVVHRLVKDGGFVGHDKSIRTGGMFREAMLKLLLAETLPCAYLAWS